MGVRDVDENNLSHHLQEEVAGHPQLGGRGLGQGPSPATTSRVPQGCRLTCVGSPVRHALSAFPAPRSSSPQRPPTKPPVGPTVGRGTQMNWHSSATGSFSPARRARRGRKKGHWPRLGPQATALLPRYSPHPHSPIHTPSPAQPHSSWGQRRATPWKPVPWDSQTCDPFTVSPGHKVI